MLQKRSLTIALSRSSLIAFVAPALLGACGEGAGVRAEPALVLAAAGASNPTVAFDPGSGLGYVVWVATDGGTSDVHLVRLEPDGSFTPALRVNDLTGDAAPHEQAPAQVTVGPHGDVYVLWQNNTEVAGRRFPASDLRLAVSTDGGRSFRHAVTVNDDDGGPPSSHTFHDIAVADDGTVYVSWIDSRVRDRVQAAHPDHGTAHAGPDLPGPEIRVARSQDGGRSFEPSVVVASGSCPCCRTSLAIGPDGAIYLAWRHVYDGDVRDIVVARAAPPELRFSEPVRVHRDGWIYPGCPHAGPSLAVDGGGAVHIGWYTGLEERQGLWYAVSRDGGRLFSAPEPLVQGGWVPPSQVRLAGEDDRVWAVWEDRRGEEGALALRQVDDPPMRTGLLPDSHSGTTPALAAAGHRLLLAWLDGESVQARWIEVDHAGR